MRGHARQALAAAALACTLGAVAHPAHADRLDDAFAQGNQAYFRGDYAAAQALYEQIDRQGVASADLFYNLGVTYYRLGHLGPAAWCFERALALDEADEDARFNLARIKAALAPPAKDRQDRIEGADRSEGWIRIVESLSLPFETWLFFVLDALTFGLLLLRLRASRDHHALLTTGASLAAAGALLVGSLLVGRAAIDRIPFGIVLPSTVAVKEGADTNYRTSFSLHAGLRVRILESDHDWLRVRLPNGLEGWVPAPNVGRL